MKDMKSMMRWFAPACMIALSACGPGAIEPLATGTEDLSKAIAPEVTGNLFPQSESCEELCECMATCAAPDAVCVESCMGAYPTEDNCACDTTNLDGQPVDGSSDTQAACTQMCDCVEGCALDDLACFCACATQAMAQCQWSCSSNDDSSCASACADCSMLCSGSRQEMNGAKGAPDATLPFGDGTLPFGRPGDGTLPLGASGGGTLPLGVPGDGTIPLALRSAAALAAFVHGGPGCDQNSYLAVALDDTGSALRVESQPFSVMLDPGQTFDRSQCTLALTLQVPAGWSFAATRIVYHDIIELPAGTAGALDSSAYFQGQLPTARASSGVCGPLTGQYRTSQSFAANDLVWSACGSAADTVIVQLGAQLVGQSGAVAVMGIDAIEEIGLLWRPCP